MPAASSPQASLFDRYLEDPASVNYTGILLRKLDSSDLLTAVHFFTSEGSATVGSSCRSSTSCDIELPGAEALGVSDSALTISLSLHPRRLTVVSRNRHPICIRRSSGTVELASNSSPFSLFSTDTIHFPSTASVAGVDLLFHNAPQDEALLSAPSSAHIDTRLPHMSSCITSAITSLRYVVKDLQQAKSVKAINDILHSRLPPVTRSLESLLGNETRSVAPVLKRSRYVTFASSVSESAKRPRISHSGTVEQWFPEARKGAFGYVVDSESNTTFFLGSRAAASAGDIHVGSHVSFSIKEAPGKFDEAFDVRIL